MNALVRKHPGEVTDNEKYYLRVHYWKFLHFSSYISTLRFCSKINVKKFSNRFVKIRYTQICMAISESYTEIDMIQRTFPKNDSLSHTFCFEEQSVLSDWVVVILLMQSCSEFANWLGILPKTEFLIAICCSLRNKSRVLAAFTPNLLTWYGKHSDVR